MLSLSSPKPPSLSSSTTFLSPIPLSLRPIHSTKPPSSTPKIIISASSTPQIPNLIIPKSPTTSAQPQNLYQPYRPPQSPLPSKYRSLDTAAIIDILANRLGLWFEYAPLISSLFRDGFTPPSIEELTGISGVEQNCLVVAAQVRESIADSPDVDLETLAFFDNGGSEILYELRLLSASQRAASAAYIVRNKLDGEKAREVARSIKDFPGRQALPGWGRFDYSKPGDCWAFSYYRLSKELKLQPEKRMTVLETALDVAESDEAKAAIKEEIEGKAGGKGGERAREDDGVRVPVVRLRMGEVAEATTVVVLPVSESQERETGVLGAPFECRSWGVFGVVGADKAWDRWVVLPRWVPLAGMGPGGVAVAFPNAKTLPWSVHGDYKKEPILVVTDRSRREVKADDGFYLVNEDEGLRVVRGLILKEMGVSESLGMVVIVVRPPRDEEDDQLSDEDWD